QLDTLADALASLEYFLEALRDQRGNRDEILGIARNSLEALGYWPLPEPVPAPAPAPEPMATAVPVEAEAPAAAVAADTAGARVDDAPAVSGTPDHAPLEAPVVVEPPGAEPEPAAAPAAPSGPVVGGFESVGEEIDEEIREVFLEEFAEEIDNLDVLLPHWRAKPEDMERLRPIRRVFHTLKGSGRLVGARVLGEFSWKVENMLNRVLDGSRPPSEAVIAMVDRAFYTLPELQAALRGDRSLATDLAPLEDAAERIAGGDETLPPEATTLVPAADAAEDAPATAEPGAPDQPLDAVPAKIDPLLLEILDAEVNGHLQTVDAWVASARAGEAAGSDPLLRALHTMNGAFAMTEVPVINSVLSPAEHYARRGGGRGGRDPGRHRGRARTAACRPQHGRDPQAAGPDAAIARCAGRTPGRAARQPARSGERSGRAGGCRRDGRSRGHAGGAT